MKILSGMDIPFNQFGGSPIICNDWYSNLPKTHEVLFLTMPSNTEKWWTIPNVHFLNTKKVRDPNFYPSYIQSLNNEIRDIINDYHPDIIHIQHLNFGISRSFIEMSSTIPKIGICHGTDTQIAKQSLFFKENLTTITDSCNNLVFPSRIMAKDFFSIYKKKKLFKIIPHGLPKYIFSKHKTHKPQTMLKFLYAGRLNQYKGADIAIKAISYINFPICLDIIGDEDESGYRTKLQSLVNIFQLNKKINFYNKISRNELLDKFSEYDCILIPSRELEAFSLTAIEAQARGLVVIYGNGGGIKNVIGHSGLYIHDNEPKTLAEIIRSIYLNVSLLDKYRFIGYENAQKYKLENQISSLISLSLNTISQKQL